MSLLNSGECFICMHDDNVYSRLTDQNIYITNCKCDGWVHTRCNEQWFKLNGSCPICRVSKEETNRCHIQPIVKYIIVTLIVIFGLLIYIINHKHKL